MIRVFDGSKASVILGFIGRSALVLVAMLELVHVVLLTLEASERSIDVLPAAENALAMVGSPFAEGFENRLFEMTGHFAVSIRMRGGGLGLDHAEAREVAEELAVKPRVEAGEAPASMGRTREGYLLPA